MRHTNKICYISHLTFLLSTISARSLIMYTCMYLHCSRSIAVDAEEDITSVDLLEIKSRDDDDEVDLISLDKKRSSKHNFTTFWGPIGFKKKLHPLSIMVC